MITNLKDWKNQNNSKINEAVALMTNYKTDQEMHDSGVKLKDAGINYGWSAEIGNLIFDTQEDKEKAEKLLNDTNESQSLSPSHREALDEYQKLRNIVQRSNDRKLMDEFIEIIDLHFLSNISIQEEEAYREAIPEIKELLKYTGLLRESTNEALRGAKVTWDDDTTMTTSINGTDEEIKAYYKIGRVFNLGKGEVDDIKSVKSVEIIDEATTNESTDYKESESVYQEIIQLDSDNFQNLLEKLAYYFKENVELLTNMDAIKIAEHLELAAATMSARTGN